VVLVLDHRLGDGAGLIMYAVVHSYQRIIILSGVARAHELASRPSLVPGCYVAADSDVGRRGLIPVALCPRSNLWQLS
jgi:type III secretory pathway component EscV